MPREGRQFEQPVSAADGSPRDFYRVSRVAALLDCHPQRIYEKIHADEIKGKRVLGLLRIPREEYERLIREAAPVNGKRRGRPRKRELV